MCVLVCACACESVCERVSVRVCVKKCRGRVEHPYLCLCVCVYREGERTRVYVGLCMYVCVGM